MHLNYARTVTRPPGEAWLRLTLACPIAPCCAGLLIFLLWLKTRWLIFPYLGLLTILVGLTLVPLAWFSANRYVRACESSDATPQLRYIRLADILIVLNVLLAVLFAVAAYQITSRITVIVTNKGDAPLERVTITAQGPDLNVGPVAPGESVRRTIRITTDGAVSFIVTRRGADVPIPQDVPVDLFRNDGRIHLRVTSTGYLLR